jgi:hypothetical protein
MNPRPRSSRRLKNCRACLQSRDSSSISPQIGVSCLILMCPRNEDSQLWPSTWRPGSALSDLVTKLSASRIQPILFMSKALREAEKRYHATELEVACLVWTCRKLRPMIQSSTSPVALTDHGATRGIYDRTSLNASDVTKANMRLVHLTIVEIVSDYLSRWFYPRRAGRGGIYSFSSPFAIQQRVSYNANSKLLLGAGIRGCCLHWEISCFFLSCWLSLTFVSVLSGTRCCEFCCLGAHYFLLSRLLLLPMRSDRMGGSVPREG